MMRPIWRRLMYAAVVALTSGGLLGCGQSESYRYKLSVSLNTPDGIKRADDVVEVHFQEISIPGKGILHDLRGEAIFLSLGPKAKPLVVLLTRRLHVVDGRGPQPHWTSDGGPSFAWISKLYCLSLSDDFMSEVARLSRVRGPHKIDPSDLPDLVTFADVNDPKSVIEVDRNDLQSTLGAGVSWNEIVLEITDEPITSGLAQKLPWLASYRRSNLRLDGTHLYSTTTLANTLSWFDFEQSK